MTNFLVRKGNKALKRKPTKFIKEFPGGEKVVAMTKHKGRLFVATEKMVYELVQDKLEKIKVWHKEKI